jgi:putative membrane protein
MKRWTTAMTTAAALTLPGAMIMAQTTTPQGGATGQPAPIRPGPGATSSGAPTPAGQATAAGDRRETSAATLNAQAFVREAAIGGMAEVELGQLAAGKASSDPVKQFAQRMVTDHNKANTELKTLAQRKGLALPTELDAKHKQTRDILAALSGAAFDRAYMDAMRKDHHQTVSDFRQQSMSGPDPEVKGWAAKMLPTLQEHMQVADRTNAGAETTGSQNGTSGGTGTNSTEIGRGQPPVNRDASVGPVVAEPACRVTPDAIRGS